jgi:Putative peptidoglycan binding domain
MNCPICAESNPENNRYCGHCGATLDVTDQRLRQQVLAVIQQEFKDEDLMAVGVADKAEERLWRWGKLVALSLTVFVAGLGFFGFSTYKEAKSHISDAAALAITSLNQVSEDNKQMISQKGAAVILQMQQEASDAGTQAAFVVTRAKANNGELEIAEEEIKDERRRIAILKHIRDASPETPIGSIRNDLFVLTGRVGNGPDGTTVLSGRIVGAPYMEGGSGPGVTAIQERLAALGCLVHPSTGEFDSATRKGVVAFVSVNGRPVTKGYLGTNLATSYLVPSAEYVDATPGSVDHDLWEELFSDSAKKCK